MHQIGTADNADHPPVPDHRKPFDVAAFHHVDDVFQRVVFADGPRTGRHDLGNFPARRMHVFLGELAGAEDEFEPFRPLALGADFTTAQKISLGNDADQFALGIDHRQAADAVLQHYACRPHHRLVGANGNDVLRHDIFDLHGFLPSLNCARSPERGFSRSSD